MKLSYKPISFIYIILILVSCENKLGGSDTSFNVYCKNKQNTKIEQFCDAIYAPLLSSEDHVLGYWPMDFNLFDYSDNKNNGESSATGPVDESFAQEGVSGTEAGSFNGEDDFIQIIHNEALNINDSFTMSTWVKFLDLENPWQGIVSKFQGGGFALWSGAPWLDYSDKVNFIIKTGGLNRIASIEKSSLAINTWYHIVGVWDGENIKIYLNGNEIESLEATGSFDNSTAPLYIGAESNGSEPTEFFKGNVDEVLLIGKSYTPSEVLNLYNMQK